MVELIGVAIVVVLTLLFGWLTRRAWRARHGLVKWPGVFVAGLLTAVLGVVTVISLVGYYRMLAPHGSAAADLKVPGTPEQMARGQRLANLCLGCHSTTVKLPLDGGATSFLGSPTSGLGTLYAPNLTPGGALKGWTDGQIVRAMREGVDKDGRPLMIMPSATFHAMSDADVQAVVAYLRSQPAVARDVPARTINLMGAVLVGAGLFPTSLQPSEPGPITAPPAGPTAAYGTYLVHISGCQECHGRDLAGGNPRGFAPVGPNLTRLVPAWSEADFLTFMQTGRDPASGRTIDLERMPWREFSAAYGDDELRGIYAYLHGLPLIDRAQAAGAAQTTTVSLVTGAPLRGASEGKS